NADNVHVIPLGVDTRLFHPRPAPRVPGLIVAVASADSPMKGVATLLRAVAQLERAPGASHTRLVVVSKPTPGGATDKLTSELGLRDRVEFQHGLSHDALAEL